MRDLPKYELRIDVQVTQPRQGERLSIHQNMMIEAETFLDIAQVLARFHDLAQVLNSEHSQTESASDG